MGIVATIMSSVQTSISTASSAEADTVTSESVSGHLHLVDDDMAVRDSLDALLSIHGFTVYTHASAAEFLLNSYLSCDCLILDVQMPGMTGLELLQHLNNETFQTPVILLTAHSDARTTASALALGASSVLAKPATELELLSAIHAATGDNGKNAS